MKSTLDKNILGKVILTIYHHGFLRYLFVGGSTFVIDIAMLVLLHGVLKINLQIATTISYWVSILYNFSLNRWWTFSAGENKQLSRHIRSYLLLLGTNYIFTLSFVTLLSAPLTYGWAKIIAVIIQISWTYPIYKNVIFINEMHRNTNVDKKEAISKA